MKAQHGKDTPKLKGKCPSCGVNFSDHMGLVGTCAELQKFKPIACKDRMPEPNEYPFLMWEPIDSRWELCVSKIHLLGMKAKWWMPMPTKPE